MWNYIELYTPCKHGDKPSIAGLFKLWWKLQSVCLRWQQITLAVPGNLLEMGILGPHSTLTEQNCQWAPAICAFNHLLGDSDASERLRTTTLVR